MNPPTGSTDATAAGGTANTPKMRHWYTSPAIGVAELAFGIIGVTLAIYIHLSSQKVRQLEFSVSPDKALVVKSGFSELHVLYKNREIKEDVTAAQVAIWNAGHESIRAANVLSTVQIATEPPVEILSASVRHMSRALVAFYPDQQFLSKGLVPLSWKILEHNDGAVLQLIYVGSPKVKLKLTGTIEGESPITQVQFPEPIMSASEQVAGFLSVESAAVGMFGGLAITTLCGAIFMRRRPITLQSGQATRILLLVSIALGVLVAEALYRIQSISVSTPPFTFF